MKNDLKMVYPAQLDASRWKLLYGGLRCFWNASVSRKLFLGGPVAVFLLKNWSGLSKIVSIEIHQNTKVQMISSTMYDRIISHEQSKP